MACIVCGGLNGNLGGSEICMDCKSKYLKDLADGRVPAPITVPQKSIVFTEGAWAAVRVMEAQMSREGKSKEEIRTAVFAFAKKLQTQYDQRCEQLRQRVRPEDVQADTRAHMEERYSY